MADLQRTPEQEREIQEFAKKWGADKAPAPKAKATPVEVKKQRSLIDILRRRNQQLSE